MSKERTDHTLHATTLVNEVYLRLIRVNQVRWQNRAHCFAMASRLMRRILVDFARARGNRKRGGNVEKVTVKEATVVHEDRSSDVLAVDEALRKLEAFDQRRSRVVELRFFGGLTLEETAEVLAVSPDTVKRDWRFARMWLLRELSGH
jgi:RNA polymerase sigma factor (TIGR02999 family)